MLECHREDEDQGHVEGYYRGCEARHEALRWAQINFPGFTAASISISRKKISKHKYEGHTFISSETLPRCSIDGYYDKLQRDSEDGERGFCSHKYKQAKRILYKVKFKMHAEMGNKLRTTRGLLPTWIVSVP